MRPPKKPLKGWVFPPPFGDHAAPNFTPWCNNFLKGLTGCILCGPGGGPPRDSPELVIPKCGPPDVDRSKPLFCPGYPKRWSPPNWPGHPLWFPPGEGFPRGNPLCRVNPPFLGIPVSSGGLCFGRNPFSPGQYPGDLFPRVKPWVHNGPINEFRATGQIKGPRARNAKSRVPRGKPRAKKPGFPKKPLLTREATKGPKSAPTRGPNVPPPWCGPKWEMGPWKSR